MKILRKIWDAVPVRASRYWAACKGVDRVAGEAAHAQADLDLAVVQRAEHKADILERERNRIAIECASYHDRLYVAQGKLLSVEQVAADLRKENGRLRADLAHASASRDEIAQEIAAEMAERFRVAALSQSALLKGGR